MTDRLEEELRRRLSPTRADGPSCSARLYAYAAGELSPTEAAEFEKHLRDCPDCRLDLAAFERSCPEHPPSTRTWLGSRLWRPMMLASGALALVLSLWKFGDLKREADPAGLHAKGGPQLTIAVHRGTNELVAPREFAEGDALGFFYSSPAPVWPVLFFCDDRGTVTRLFPVNEAILFPTADRAPLPAGVVIEPAQGCEWLVAFFSPEAARPALDEMAQTLRGSLANRGPDCKLAPPKLAGVATQIIPLASRP